MISATIQSLSLCAVALGGVYLGIAFLNGLLLPSIFKGLYALTDNAFLRILASFPLFFGPSNYLAGKAYEVGGAAVGGAGSVVFTVLWMTVMAVIIDDAKVNMWIIGGAGIAIAGCLMVVYGIKG